MATARSWEAPASENLPSPACAIPIEPRIAPTSPWCEPIVLSMMGSARTYRARALASRPCCSAISPMLARIVPISSCRHPSSACFRLSSRSYRSNAAARSPSLLSRSATSLLVESGGGSGGVAGGSVTLSLWSLGFFRGRRTLFSRDLRRGLAAFFALVTSGPYGRCGTLPSFSMPTAMLKVRRWTGEVCLGDSDAESMS